jgi:hypothetical protein
MSIKVKLRIADTVIAFDSDFPLQKFTLAQERKTFSQRFRNFLYNGNQTPDILINVVVVKDLPAIEGAKELFSVYHPEDDSENWRIFEKGRGYIYKCLLSEREQVMRVNKIFNRVTAYVLPQERKYFVWHFTPIIYDFLQVLLIHYFAQRKTGIFMHASGVKDLDDKGFLFAGRSGCGKTTMAKLWSRFPRAMILNDDRIILKKEKGGFFIYGTPWHGAFSDYLGSRMESAPLSELFLIYRHSENTLRRLGFEEGFKHLYPAIFPVFWSKKLSQNVISFCEDLAASGVYSLGFVKDKSVIKFIRQA